MPARLNARHQAMVRDKIQASQLVNRLQNHVLKGTKMLNSQVRAAMYLLSQSIGNPSQEITGSLEIEDKPLEEMSEAEILEELRLEREKRLREEAAARKK